MDNDPARRIVDRDPNALFTVGLQELREEYNPDGPAIQIWRIPFVTRSGIGAWIDVPRSRYSAKNVGELVKAEAEEIERVQGLGRG